jgi:hypothetical protein
MGKPPSEPSHYINERKLFFPAIKQQKKLHFFAERILSHPEKKIKTFFTEIP